MAGKDGKAQLAEIAVSTHSHPKVAGHAAPRTFEAAYGFNTQPPEGGWRTDHQDARARAVSTHSHPKVAGKRVQKMVRFACGFNTQPPEGGWKLFSVLKMKLRKFQHTATRRWLEVTYTGFHVLLSFNTQPPEGGWQTSAKMIDKEKVSTHSHPKVAGLFVCILNNSRGSFNTQPPEGGWKFCDGVKLQDTVSTHSHPKVAGASLKSLVPSGFAAPISLSSQEKREREYNTAFSVTPAFAIS